MRSLLSTLILAFTALPLSVNGQSGYNTTDCMALDGKVSWSVSQPRYSNATTSVQIVGPPIGRILIMIITNNDAVFDVRCPGDLDTNPYTPKQVLQASCTTDFAGYYYPSKDAVGEVWMSGSFDERNYNLSFTQTWWCQEDASAPLYNVTAVGSGILFSGSDCNAAPWGTQCDASQVNITGKVISRKIHTNTTQIE